MLKQRRHLTEYCERDVFLWKARTSIDKCL